MVKVFKILEVRQNTKRIRNSEEVAREWEDERLQDEEIIFSLDV